MYNPFKKPAPEPTETEKEPVRYTPPKDPVERVADQRRVKASLLAESMSSAIRSNVPVRPVNPRGNGVMDDASTGTLYAHTDSIDHVHVDYFGSHGYIGYMTCAILAQHWAIDKACRVPVEDALRKGWELSKNDGEAIEPDIMAKITSAEKKFKVRALAQNFAEFGRKFGIRVAIPQFDLSHVQVPNKPNATEQDKKRYFYENPFNIDGVVKGSFKGVLLRDPYYMTPINGPETSDPGSINFYVPEYWQVGGIKYHHTHCIIYRHADVADTLKPSYIYGSVSITQQIFEAVYNAEVTATEIPKLIQNMRLLVYHGDISTALTNEDEFFEKMQWLDSVRNNHNIMWLGTEEKLEHIQTTLTGMDELVAGRYKLVCMIAQMPVSKFMGDGFTGGLVQGGGEEATYHESLEVIQAKMPDFLERIYTIICKSELGFTIDGLDIKFNKLDAMTEKEQAELNKLKADTMSIYSQEGAIDALEIRTALANDPNSGFSGLELEGWEEPVEDDYASAVGGGTNPETGQGSGRHVEIDEEGDIVKGISARVN